MNSINKVDVENEKLKQDILGFIRSDSEIIDCLSYFNCTGRHKLVLGTFIEYGRGALKGGLFTEEDIEHVIDHFDEFAATNEIIMNYLDCKLDDQILVKKEIKDMYVEADKSIERDVPNGISKDKILTFNNGTRQSYIPDQEENQKRGFVGAFLISALAATIEITTVLYIVLKGM